MNIALCGTMLRKNKNCVATLRPKRKLHVIVQFLVNLGHSKTTQTRNASKLKTQVYAPPLGTSLYTSARVSSAANTTQHHQHAQHHRHLQRVLAALKLLENWKKLKSGRTTKLLKLDAVQRAFCAKNKPTSSANQCGSNTTLATKLLSVIMKQLPGADSSILQSCPTPV